MKAEKNIRKILWLVIFIAVVAIVTIAIVFIPKTVRDDERGPIEITKILPAKDYTWEQYESMTDEQREEFKERFETTDDFVEWLDNVGEEEVVLYPWDLNGKVPSEYTFAEYEQLTEKEKEAFRNTFLSEEDFNLWKAKAENAANVGFVSGETESGKPDRENNETENPESEDIVLYPWDLSGKAPNEYTLAEYEQLTEKEKKAFKAAFLSEEEFNLWDIKVGKVKVEDIVLYPWEVAGKAPHNYTWAEYERLTEEEKEAFEKAFSSAEDFEKWKKQAH